MSEFSNSYIITNRSTPAATSHASTTPLPNGQMWFYMAPAQYDPEPGDYKTSQTSGSTSPPSDFLTALTADLTAQGDNPQLTVLIHGLSFLFNNAINLLSIFGCDLLNTGNYKGLVIAFDWPSYDFLDSSLYYASSPYAFPPKATSGTIRDNINGSVAAFQNLIEMLSGLQKSVEGLAINFVTHSEGNYMIMLGCNDLAAEKISFNISQTIMLAADVNNGAFQLAPAVAGAGQGLPISGMSGSVTVYYSTNDTVLSASETAFPSYHNPAFYGRLGMVGPTSYSTGALPANVYGLDCSQVINETVAQPFLASGTTLHLAYFYVPQVASDIAQVLNGTAPSSITNRVSTGAQDGQQYAMQVAQPSTQIEDPRRKHARTVAMLAGRARP